jgi:hypothetical protein
MIGGRVKLQFLSDTNTKMAVLTSVDISTMGNPPASRNVPK